MVNLISSKKGVELHFGVDDELMGLKDDSW